MIVQSVMVRFLERPTHSVADLFRDGIVRCRRRPAVESQGGPPW
jgi:hypothetical protein